MCVKYQAQCLEEIKFPAGTCCYSNEATTIQIVKSQCEVTITSTQYPPVNTLCISRDVLGYAAITSMPKNLR